MLKTKYLGWTLVRLTNGSKEWTATYEKYITNKTVTNLTWTEIGFGHSPESAVADAQKKVQERERR